MSNRLRPVALIIMDGWGLAPASEGNAVARAQTPNVDRWSAECPFTMLEASGLDVGLPPGQIGNSEVGHLNIGAGFVVYQDFTRISKSISDGDFFTNPALIGAFAHAANHGSAVQIMGLFGPGGVHAHEDHLHALLDLGVRMQALHNRPIPIFLHLFLDGRDVLPRSALGFLETLEANLAKYGVGQVATVSGRYYAMDRDQRWERTGRAYDAMVLGQGETAPSARAAIEAAYAAEVGDEFVLPTVITGADGQPVARIGNGDAVIFTNFRPDRGRQMTAALTWPDLNAKITAHYQRQAAEGQQLPPQIWQRSSLPADLAVITFTRYAENLPVTVAFPPHGVEQPLAKVVSDAGLQQFHLAETEKYPHVTFFLNGGREQPFAGEERTIVASPKVATYDLQPEMSAAGVKAALLGAIASDQFDLIIVNFANPDMVGHTGDIPAVITACETVDAALGEAVPALLAKGGAALLIADHGNAEQMIDPETGGPHTAHTTNPVPCILVAPEGSGLAKAAISLRAGGRLADVAPTLLDLLGVALAPAMTGQSLIVRK